MKTLFFSLSSGEVFKNLVLFPGSVADQLKAWLAAGADCRIVFIVQSKDLERYEPILRERFGPAVIVAAAAVPAAYPRWSKIFYFFYSYLIYTDSTRVLSTMGMRLDDAPGAGRRLMNPLKIAISRSFGRSRWIKVKLVPWLYNFFFLARPFKSIFEKYQPDVVFMGDLFRRFDAEVLAEARRQAVRTLGMTSGWDHLDKYYLPLHVDRLLVQSGQVRDFALRYQSYRPEELISVGFPYLDYVTRQSYRRPREAVLADLGFPPGSKYLLYIAGTMYCPDETDIIEEIIKWADSGQLGHDVRVVIRPYPGGRGKDLTYDQEKFKTFQAHPRVSFLMDKFWGDLEKTDRFLNILAEADAVMAIFSTAALEAVALDRPTLTIAFDGYKARPLMQSIRRFALREHFKKVLETGGLRRVESFADLHQALKTYLDRPETDRERREQLRQEVLYRLDSQASTRVFMALKDGLS